MDKLSERRLAENEVIFRESNKTVAEFIKSSPASDLPLQFYCECSRESCRDRIRLTAEQYHDLHQNNRQFIVIPGHEMSEIEKVVTSEPDYNVIEKFMEPPSPEQLNRAVKNLKL